MTSNTPDSGTLAAMIDERIGQDFEGECHLAEHEARQIIAALSPDQRPAGEVERYLVTVGRDAKNENNRRLHVNGSQWAKVYGWDRQSVETRCELLANGLRALGSLPSVSWRPDREKVARIIDRLAFGVTGDPATDDRRSVQRDMALAKADAILALPQSTQTEGLSRETLVSLIMEETTDDLVADGWRAVGKPNVLVQGCRYLRRSEKANATEGYENPEASAKQFAGFIADRILSEIAKGRQP